MKRQNLALRAAAWTMAFFLMWQPAMSAMAKEYGPGMKLTPEDIAQMQAEAQERQGTAEEAPEEQTAPREVTEEEIDAYFDGSVFVGDSVMLGFRNYAMRRQDTFLNRIKFLAAGSLSVHNALWPVSSKSVHPVYQGEKRLLWDSLSMMEAKRIFLFFGLNDLDAGGVDGSCEKYQELIAKIHEALPDAEIHLMSMTYTLAGKGKGRLNNDNIRLFNEKLRGMASENGWGYVELAAPLSDANGDLAPQFCSDFYVHQTEAAYDVWTGVLREYAKSQLNGTSAYPVTASSQKETEEIQ